MSGDWVDALTAQLARVTERQWLRDEDAAHVYAAWLSGVCIEPRCPYHPKPEDENR